VKIIINPCMLESADSTKVKELVADSHNPEEKEKAQSRETVHDVAEHMNSLSSIEDCLKLFSHCLTDCNYCSKVAAELPETDGSKNVEPIMASSNVNTTIDGDQTEMSDMKTCPSDFGSLSAESPSRQPYLPDSHHQVTLSEDITSEEVTSGKSCGEKDLTSCSTTHEKTESHEGVQEAALSCLTTDEQTDLLSTQNIQDTSTHKHSSGKQVMYDRAQQVAGKQNKQTATQTRLISKLPPVLTIQLERPASGLPKLSGHVSFKEILQVGPFMDPRY
jgi:ubiquitin carboxyl-terminal hydrolase 16/45